MFPFIKDTNNARKVLQEQPPPPKLWESKNITENLSKQEKNSNVHISEKLKRKQQHQLQKKTNEILLTPDSTVRISNIDLPSEKKENSASKNNSSEVEAITEGKMILLRNYHF